MTAAKLRVIRSPADSTDAELLARVASQDVAALGLLYDRYAAQLLRYARRLDREYAEDVVQTVFLRVLRIAEKFDENAASARPWLFTIATHVVHERRRSLRRAAAALARLRYQPERSVNSVADLRTDIERSLGKISLAKRTVVVLAEVEGFSCDEIAKMLQVPVGTVWTRLHHARAELRRLHDGATP